MWIIIITLLIFTVVFVVINGMIVLSRKYSYSEKAHIFIPILVVATGLLFLIQPEPIFNLPALKVLGLVVALLTIYLVFEWFWHKKLSLQNVYGLETIPAGGESIVQLHPVGGSVKLFEIFFKM